MPSPAPDAGALPRAPRLPLRFPHLGGGAASPALAAVRAPPRAVLLPRVPSVRTGPGGRGAGTGSECGVG